MSLYWLTCACGQRMKVPEKALGTSRRCFKCGEWITVSPENTVSVDGGGRVAGARPLEPDSRAATPGTPDDEQGAESPEGVDVSSQDSGLRREQGPQGSRRTPAKARIGELLLQEGLVSEPQLQMALKRQKDKGGKLVENLIALEYLDTRTFLKFLSRQPGTASIDLLNYTIPQEVINLVPAEFALKHELLPIDKMGKQLTVGMACPLDSQTVNELVEMTGMKIRPLLVSMSDIQVALGRYYQPPKMKTFSLPVARMSRDAVVPPVKEVPVYSAEDTLPMVESALTFETVIRLVREVTSLPALPETVRQVRAAMERPDSSPLEVADIIQRDPSIAAKVLSLANSPAYGFSHHVDSVQLATSLLGLREIYSVVLSSAVIDYFERSDAFDYKAFWKRSMLCATAAKAIARCCGRKDISGIFAAGLLHDIGRAVLAEVVPQRYKELSQDMPDSELVAQENKLFGVAHPEVGYILAKGWKLPIAICEAIRFHNDFLQAQHGQDIVTVVALAALMTDTYGRINKSNVREFAERCKLMLQELQMSEQDFIRVLAETSASIKAELKEPIEASSTGV